MGGRQVHVDAVSPWVDLKALRMGRKPNIGNLLPGGGVECRQPAAAIAHHQPPRFVGADIVSVVAKFYRSRRGQIIPLEQAHAAIVALETATTPVSGE